VSLIHGVPAQTFQASAPDRIDAEPMEAALHLRASPNGFSFAGGVPDTDLLPAELVAKAIESLATAPQRELLQYSDPRGFRPLRQWIANYHDGCATSTVENIFITQGAQQAIYLTVSSLVGEGATIVTISPTYFGAHQVFNYLGLKQLPIELGANGLDLDQLEQHFAKHQAKLFYLSANFHNPTGLSVPDWQKPLLVQLARKYGVLIIEDDVLGELYFGVRKATLMNLGPDVVIYIGSFSKIVAPGLRVGFVCAPAAVCDRIAKLRPYIDVAPGSPTQYVVHSVCSDVAYRQALDSLRMRCERRKDALLAMLASQWSEDAQWDTPEGGLFAWVRIPSLEADVFAERALESDVAVMPGKLFYGKDSVAGRDRLRLSWANVSEARIAEGMTRLRNVMKKLCVPTLHAIPSVNH
jgi:2-aminoadipate transaminase